MFSVYLLQFLGQLLVILLVVRRPAPLSLRLDCNRVISLRIIPRGSQCRTHELRQRLGKLLDRPYSGCFTLSSNPVSSTRHGNICQNNLLIHVLPARPTRSGVGCLSLGQSFLIKRDTPFPSFCEVILVKTRIIRLIMKGSHCLKWPA